MDSIDQALKQLRITLKPNTLPSLQAAGSAPSRFYHDNVHSAQVSEALDADVKNDIRQLLGSSEDFIADLAAISTLAGLFHDAVYLTVDQGMAADISETLFPYLDIQSKPPRLKENHDTTLDRVKRVFGIAQADHFATSPAGLNEYASAIYAAMSCENLAPKWQIALAAHIEATIPFRDASHFSNLEANVIAANAALAPEARFTEKEIKALMISAVTTANKDVASFKGGNYREPMEKLRHFLNDNWKLIPEMQPVMNTEKPGTYSAKLFRKTLEDSNKFLQRHLSWERIFHQYRSGDIAYPPDEKFQAMQTQANQIKRMHDDYMAAKLAAIMLVEALADIAGKSDMPLESLLPSLPLDRLKPRHSFPMNEEQQVVLEILQHGRGGTIGFDIDASPIAGLLYQGAGPRQVKLLAQSKLSPREYMEKVAECIGTDAYHVIADTMIANLHAAGETKAARLLNDAGPKR